MRVALKCCDLIKFDDFLITWYNYSQLLKILTVESFLLFMALWSANIKATASLNIEIRKLSFAAKFREIFITQ